jgi:protein-L-isoaspartate(D-aspartate) O-methyltransferase
MVRDQILPRGITDRRVLEAMSRVPRHLFAHGIDAASCYGDKPVQIGHGQTMSQPYMVALMTQLLELHGAERVLDVGCGSGYHAALLSLLVAEVYAIERIASLLHGARRAFQTSGYHVTSTLGDGTLGWPEHAPFDRILVAAASARVPSGLRNQLADKGIMVMPVGGPRVQRLAVIRRMGAVFQVHGNVPCRFVPLISSTIEHNGG